MDSWDGRVVVRLLLWRHLRGLLAARLLTVVLLIVGRIILRAAGRCLARRS